jgi:uncharacterized protein
MEGESLFEPQDDGAQDEDYLAVRIDNVSISNLGFIVFLRHGQESRVLPIFVGGNEAHSIALVLNGQPTPRPMTHDLIRTVLENLGWRVANIRVTRLVENTFYGRIYLEHDTHPPMDFDARPSDAIALALRFKAHMEVHKAVFEQASVPIAKELASGDVETHVEDSSAPSEKSSRPDLADKPVPAKDPVQELQKRLAHAIHEEHYEEAAKLRDALRAALKRLQTGN